MGDKTECCDTDRCVSSGVQVHVVLTTLSKVKLFLTEKWKSSQQLRLLATGQDSMLRKITFVGFICDVK